MSAAGTEVNPTAPVQLPAGGLRQGGIFLGLLALIWGWAIWIDSPFWATNPNYSYGWVVPALVVFFLWRRIQTRPESFWSELSASARPFWKPHALLLAIPALAMFPLEVQRTEYHQSGIVLWAINLLAVGLTLAGSLWLGGTGLLRVVAFPVLFFLTAVPWPAKIEQPLIQNMMIAVAQVVTELLLWLGVPVDSNGAVLKLTNGTVGIVEACSGIRSLQSGLMVCLAVSELVLLSPLRRCVLVAATVALALFSNLARTFTLCWIMEHQGDAAMHHRHDLVGNIAMYSLYFIIWLTGQFLAPKGGAGDVWPSGRQVTDTTKFRWLHWERIPDFRPLLGVAILTLATVHGWYMVLKVRTRPQTQPQFAARSALPPGTEKLKFDEEVWARLGADSGEQLRTKSTEAPLGFVDSYHLFWKPSPMSKVALHHRPDICMPGNGWKQVGEVQALEIPISGRPLKFLVFHFERPDVRAVQVWGVWRNGQPVDMDYTQRLQALPERYGWLPTSRHMMGVELVSCFVAYRSGEAPLKLIEKTLPTFYDFTPFEASGAPASPPAAPGQ